MLNQQESQFPPRHFPGLLALALVGGLISPVALAQTPPSTRPPTPITVVEIKPENTPATFEFTGKTASSRQVEINARVEGYLDKIAYVEGSLVKTGQLLFQLDPKPFQAALDNAKAVLAQQEALLTRARQTLARVKPLAKQNAVSQQDLDNSTAGVMTAEAQVQAAKAQVETAQLNLGYTTIKSPLNGLSSSANFREGALITPAGKNAQLTTIVQIDPMWVNFGVGENEVLKIKAQKEAGQLKGPGLDKVEVELILADGAIYPQKGQITFVDPVVNAQTGTYNIRAVVPNPSNQLSPGQFVRVQLKGAVRPNAIMVPQVAVMQGPSGKFVFVVSPDNTAQPKPVQLGDWYGDQWIVNSGLESGDRVVVDGAVRLQPGAPVQIRSAAAPAPEPAKVPSATPLKP
ncbi:efflux RND transporter periplasmic adaptor subunit [Candidatus Contendibacter odensensis]|uniref:Efflux pump periplasmic linker BepD n=1 Tax=Candidatus Contendobacter odensis Run_B_J11 TaxID=1400861 RepID=A0A7U7GC88_9GAMM|nr:efflux RND transporter periplasmic adaptor subunit [Candidatus Contendobacter odensis]CDH45506.1 putative Efflux pump periplasmic linker BepD [Candidatus Contendobacter odensis Run_B_J11]